MPQFGWHINVAKCIGCRGCEAACKQEFNLPEGVQRRRVVVQDGYSGGAGAEKPFRRFITMSCNHCKDPGCLPACPVQAITKDASTGIVAHDPTKCIGCRRCTHGCPYGAITFDATNKRVDKCSGCAHRLTSTALPAEKKIPACVISCSSYALHWSPDLATIDGLAFGEALKTTQAPTGSAEISDPSLTSPSTRFSLKRTDVVK